jgi:hypothetical protein
LSTGLRSPPVFSADVGFIPVLEENVVTSRAAHCECRLGLLRSQQAPAGVSSGRSGVSTNHLQLCTHSGLEHEKRSGLSRSCKWFTGAYRPRLDSQMRRCTVVPFKRIVPYPDIEHALNFLRDPLWNCQSLVRACDWLRPCAASRMLKRASFQGPSSAAPPPHFSLWSLLISRLSLAEHVVMIDVSEPRAPVARMI